MSAPHADAAAVLAPAVARDFIRAGRAIFTIESLKSGSHFTFKARRPEGSEDGPVFVGLLTGPDNGEDFQFLGTIFPDGSYRHGRRSRIGEHAPSAVAFRWTWDKLSAGRLPEQVRIWHEGRCGCCGRRLTVPESVALGFGPDCAGKLGLDKGPTMPTAEVSAPAPAESPTPNVCDTCGAVRCPDGCCCAC